MKPCIICRQIKPINQFYKQKGMKDGHLNKCIKCCLEQYKYRRENNIHKITREITSEKECYICHKIKKLSCFYKQSGMVDGRLNKCIECCNKYCEIQRKTNPQYYLRSLYNGMQWRCKNNARYKGLKILSRDAWILWCNKNMYKFLKLYKQWQNNGYKNSFSPSIDRINNNLGYTKDNMQWLTQSQNAKKGNK